MARLLSGVLIAVLVFWWCSVASAQVGQPPTNAPSPAAPPPPPHTLPNPPLPNPLPNFFDPKSPDPNLRNPNIPPSNTLRTPHNNPYPVLPWGDGQLGAAGVYGAPVRTWEMPERSFVLDLMVPQPGSLPATWESVPVTVPGYVVVETTRGYGYPGRWTVVQVALGGYRWQWVPPAFYPK